MSSYRRQCDQPDSPFTPINLPFTEQNHQGYAQKINHETFEWDFDIIQGYVFMPTRKYDRKIRSGIAGKHPGKHQ